MKYDDGDVISRLFLRAAATGESTLVTRGHFMISTREPIVAVFANSWGRAHSYRKNAQTHNKKNFWF